MRNHLAQHPGPDVAGLLEHWVEEGLLTAEAAERIRAAEQAEGRDVGAGPGPRTSVSVEALAYVGGALVAVAVVLIGGRFWTDLSFLARVGLTAAGALLTFAAGAAVPQPATPSQGPAHRLRAVMWTASVAAVAALSALLAADGGQWSGPGVALAAGAGSAGYGALLWRRHPNVPGLAGLLASTSLAAGAAAAFSAPDVLPGLAVCGVAALWCAAVRAGVLHPSGAGYALGAVAGFVGADIMLLATSGGTRDWGLWAGVLTAAAALAVAVRVRDRVVLAVAALGTMQLIPTMADRWFGGATATGPVLLAVGALLVGLAVLATRRPHGKGPR